MAVTTRFELNGKPQVAESPLKAGKLLSLAGVPTDGYCIRASDGTEYCDPEQLIEIRNGEKIETRKRSSDDSPEIRYSVNGEQQITKTNPVSLESILSIAGPAASIEINDLECYYLENIADGSKYDGLSDLITLRDGDQFIAVHIGATPVA